MNALAPIAEGEALRGLAWWAAEAERNGTDWRGILLMVLRSLGIITPCDICECEPCQTPSFCDLAREADAKISRQPKIARPRPTPQATIEAIKQTVRDRGIAALKETATRERLRQCDGAAIAAIDAWLLKRDIRR